MINDLLFTFILSFLLISISLEDARTMLISNGKLEMFAILGFIYLFIHENLERESNDLNLIINHSCIAIIIFISMTTISLLSYKLTRVNSLGLGDIKLASFASLWLGLESTLYAIYISFILSSIYFLYTKIYKDVGIFYQYPFAPFISIGIFCTWIIAKI